MAAELDKPGSVDVTLTQHIIVCALEELGCLVESLGTSASPLVSEPSTGWCNFISVVKYTTLNSMLIT